MRSFLFAIFIAIVLASRPCDEEDNKGKLWCNTEKTFEERAKALVAELTLDEKVTLLGNTASSVDRLHIPAYEWWNEALHGVANSPGVHFREGSLHATSFPQVSTTACSFNTTLYTKIAESISTEARVFNNHGNAGLTYWTPNINIVRDPRWGRGQETPGEDPILTATYASHFVKGLQEGEDDKYLKASACCKHYTAYDLEDWHGIWRHSFDAIVSEADMEDTFQVPFESCIVDGKVTSLMCSYNRVNGVPSCVNHDLLTTTARDKWGFDGYITGDCGAIDDIEQYHKWSNDTNYIMQQSLGAGNDIDCGGFFPRNTKRAIESGMLDIRYVNRALSHLFKVQMRLGMFDPLDKQIYSKYDTDKLESKEHIQIAEEACEQGIVLLKNEGNFLPIDSTTIKTIALMGPHSNNANVQLGNYFGQPSYIVTPLEGLSHYGEVKSYNGCNNSNCDSIENMDEMIASVSTADLTVLAVGINQDIEAEGKDRNEISLPGKQQELIDTLTEKSKNPVILVISSGSSLDLESVKNNKKIAAILWTGYAAQQEGEALAKIIFGAVNPSGRLVYTLYPHSYVDKVPLTDMGMRPNDSTQSPGRTYRYYADTPVYSFGHGLSYSTFKHTISPSISELPYSTIKKQLDEETRFEAHSLLSLKINIENTSDRDGAESILVYSIPPNAGKEGIPNKQLITFTKVFVNGHTSIDTSVDITGYAFTVNTDGKRRPLVGEWKIQVEEQEYSFTITE